MDTPVDQKIYRTQGCPGPGLFHSGTQFPDPDPRFRVLIGNISVQPFKLGRNFKTEKKNLDPDGKS
mgnify:CR=1 FL=1